MPMEFVTAPDAYIPHVAVVDGEGHTLAMISITDQLPAINAEALAYLLIQVWPRPPLSAASR